jgi:hypothetical protein
VACFTTTLNQGRPWVTSTYPTGEKPGCELWRVAVDFVPDDYDMFHGASKDGQNHVVCIRRVGAAVHEDLIKAILKDRVGFMTADKRNEFFPDGAANSYDRLVEASKFIVNVMFTSPVSLAGAEWSTVRKNEYGSGDLVLAMRQRDQPKFLVKWLVSQVKLAIGGVGPETQGLIRAAIKAYFNEKLKEYVTGFADRSAAAMGQLDLNAVEDVDDA